MTEIMSHTNKEKVVALNSSNGADVPLRTYSTNQQEKTVNLHVRNRSKAQNMCIVHARIILYCYTVKVMQRTTGNLVA